MNSDLILEKVKTYIKLTKDYYQDYGLSTGNNMFHERYLICGALLEKIKDFEKGSN